MEKIDLSQLDHSILAEPKAEPQEIMPAQAEPTDELDLLIQNLETIEKSLAGLHVAMRLASARLAQLEAHMAYLLSKDDQAGPHIKRMMENANGDQNTTPST